MTSKNKLIAKIYIFIFGLFSNLRITLIGQMPVSELLAVTNSLSINYWKGIFKNPDLKKINIAYFIFFLAQVVSDFANKSSFDNSIRGWANILVAILVLNFFYTYFNRHKSYIIIFLLGQLISLAIFTPDTFGTSIYEMSFFKFRVTPVLNNLVLIISYFLIASKSVRKTYISILCIVYGLICIALDSRSNGVFMIITGLLFYYRNIFTRTRLKKILLIFIAFSVIFQVLYSIYVTQVLSGNLGGEHAKIQMERIENPYNPFNILESGRSEVLVALYAIADKPIFGHGSWAPDPGGKYTAMQFDLQKQSEKFSSYMEYSGQLIIPSHSVIFGAWMTAGIIAFVCMLYIYYIGLKRIFYLFRNPIATNSSLFLVIIFFSLNIIWNMFFSPLPHIRQTLPFQLALILVVYKKTFTYSQLRKIK